MDDHLHRYELHVGDMMSALERALSDRGYQAAQRGDAWVFETRWNRGAAHGEIGSLLYGILAAQLREID